MSRVEEKLLMGTKTIPGRKMHLEKQRGRSVRAEGD